MVGVEVEVRPACKLSDPAPLCAPVQSLLDYTHVRPIQLAKPSEVHVDFLVGHREALIFWVSRLS